MNACTGIPNFLFIGADKTGSSWLHYVLRQHPHCHVPACKDIYYFDRYYHKGGRWYLRQFGDVPVQARAVGELSHDYLYSDAACERIASDLPRVKLLCCLRDPAERCFSHYLYLRRNGLTQTSFDDALHSQPEILEHSRYARHLAPYLSQHGERLLILWFEDLQRDPVAFARRVFGFLDLDLPPGLDLRTPVRSAQRARNALLARALSRGAWLTRKLGFPALVGALKHSPATRLLYTDFESGRRPTLGLEQRAAVIARLRPDIEDLQSRLGQDLSAWLRVERSTSA